MVYISIVDVIAVWTDSLDPNAYWRKLKQRLKTEGSQLATNCSQLKMLAKVALKELESKTGKKVVSHLSANRILALQKSILETDEQ
jgi:maleate cis-trans isomerase